jgi:hypothetical protein
LTTALAPVLQQWVLDGPVAQGLDRANWTYAELADHLYKTRGLRVQKSAMQAFCHKHDIRPYRPTYRFLRGDPVKQAAACEDLAVLKKLRRQTQLDEQLFQSVQIRDRVTSEAALLSPCFSTLLQLRTHPTPRRHIVRG